MISPRSVAVLGIGFGARAVAALGLTPVVVEIREPVYAGELHRGPPVWPTKRKRRDEVLLMKGWI